MRGRKTIIHKTYKPVTFTILEKHKEKYNLEFSHSLFRFHVKLTRLQKKPLTHVSLKGAVPWDKQPRL